MEETRYYGSTLVNIFWAYGQKYSDTLCGGKLFADHSPQGIEAIHEEEEIALGLNKLTEEESTLIVLSWGNKE